MKMNDIMNVILDLSFSQGFYGRLYRSILELSEEKYNELKDLWEGMNFKDNLDFILYIES